MNRVGALRGWISLMCQKVPNSGKPLKHIVPSHNGNVLCGQNNYLGTVTSYMMNESEMGYRGSKSVLVSSNTVKEQRVDGSWSNYLLSDSLLRCTLMGFERNYQVKVPSNQLNKTNNFCTSACAQVQFTKLDPWFVTGFCDGEASFSVSIYIDKRIKGRVGWVVKPSFQISLHSAARRGI